ncbi:hypothetical protein FB45DRAFT_160094 [Roridomyces roridus]|uniref:Extracellular serine-rich protein n=1 Tax=Roridomyces roridus TaxID=1738132 RepID=A0AAD7BFL8_9AGAR|nr:hypothetical protein FB45DRAFT_160094 [Roridomyces roridus]
MLLTALFLLFSFVAAQDDNDGLAPQGSDVTGHVNINVVTQPGGADSVFSPPNVTASNGSTVTFWFADSKLSPKACSVTQSSFAKPCTYLVTDVNTNEGFDSGLAPSGTQFTLTITDDTEPVWFYCKNFSNHCGENGTVGSINAPTTGSSTFAAFQAAAQKADASSQTDNGFIPGNSAGQGASASAGPANGTVSTKGSDHVGAIAGGVVGGVLVLALVIAVTLWWLRRRSRLRFQRIPERTSRPPSPFAPPSAEMSEEIWQGSTLSLVHPTVTEVVASQTAMWEKSGGSPSSLPPSSGGAGSLRLARSDSGTEMQLLAMAERVAQLEVAIGSPVGELPPNYSQ